MSIPSSAKKSSSDISPESFLNLDTFSSMSEISRKTLANKSSDASTGSSNKFLTTNITSPSILSSMSSCFIINPLSDGTSTLAAYNFVLPSISTK